MKNNIPLLSIRIRVNDTESLAAWRKCFRSIKANRLCCNEIWFSTGIGAPEIGWHERNVAVISRAVEDVKSLGIIPSLQFQGTLGHGDQLASPDLFGAKNWKGWTDWRGTEALYCSCPRQKGFHEYLRKVSLLYAKVGFSSLWIDDDLRITNHYPADNSQGNVGCWCDTCLEEFGKSMGRIWTRERLKEEMASNDELAAKWRVFSVSGLSMVAQTISRAFCSVSPMTAMGLQHASGEGSVDQVKAVLDVLHKESRQSVGLRPGGAAYYDENPNEAIQKSIQSGNFRKMIGSPGHIGRYVAEIESWPRSYYSKSPRGVLAEGWTALMYGMNGISCFITNGAVEDYSLYGRTFWRTLSRASAALSGYANAISGAKAVGVGAPQMSSWGVRRCAIPVVTGDGMSIGMLTPEEANLSASTMSSSEVQKLRNEIDARSGGLPAVVKSPFLGLFQIHAEKGGSLRCLSLMNLTISEQGPVKLLLRGVPSSWNSAIWHEMCKKPRRLEIEKKAGDAWVTIPKIGAWNGGYLAGAE